MTLRSALALSFTLLTGPLWAQPYGSSVVGTDFDVITDEDPSVFSKLESKGVAKAEMPDKTQDDAQLLQPAFNFVASFKDGARVKVAVDHDFGSEAAAKAEALRYLPRLGKLPSALRGGVKRLVIHKGEPDATAFSDAGLIVVYSANATKRIKTHDLEETLFHESVHASWDQEHAGSAAWRAAQRADGAFATRYAKRKPAREDLAESALFAFALIHRPGRIPAAEAERIWRTIPNRIVFVRRLLPPGKPLIHGVGERAPGSKERDQQGKGAEEQGDEGAARPIDLPSWKPCQEACALRRLELTSARGVSDVLSNALVAGLGRDEGEVMAYLGAEQERKGLSARQLLGQAAKRFNVAPAELAEALRRYLHCNCP